MRAILRTSTFVSSSETAGRSRETRGFTIVSPVTATAHYLTACFQRPPFPVQLSQQQCPVSFPVKNASSEMARGRLPDTALGGPNAYLCHEDSLLCQLKQGPCHGGDQTGPHRYFPGDTLKLGAGVILGIVILQVHRM